MSNAFSRFVPSTPAGRLALGAITIWPLVCIPLFFVYVWSTMFTMEGGGELPMVAFGVVFVIHMATILAAIATQVYYVIHAALDEQLQTEHKVIWLICILMLGMLAMPVYWYVRLWRTRWDARPASQIPGWARSH